MPTLSDELRAHAARNLPAAGIPEGGALYTGLVDLLDRFGGMDFGDVGREEAARLFGRLVKFENLPVEGLAGEDTAPDPALLAPWQRKMLEMVPRSTFVQLPAWMSEQSSMWRFASYADFLNDTITHQGTQMAAGLSFAFQPENIVEMGVHGGFTTLLLCRLNPAARVYAVDKHSRMPDAMLPICTAAMMNMVPNLTVHIGNSWDFSLPANVGLCFIDGDHAGDAPLRDSWRAWENRNAAGDWCIAWDDYHPSNADVVRGVDAFVAEVGYSLNVLGSWVWIGTKPAAEVQRVLAA